MSLKLLFKDEQTKTLNSREGQRTGSDQQIQRLEETELRKAGRTVGVKKSGRAWRNIGKYLNVHLNLTVSLSEWYLKRHLKL